MGFFYVIINRDLDTIIDNVIVFENRLKNTF